MKLQCFDSTYETDFENTPTLPFIGKKTYVTIEIWIEKRQKSQKRVFVNILSENKF